MSPVSLVQKNHYVPQFILSEFVRDGTLFVLQKSNGQVRRSTNTEDVFCVRGLYHDAIERLFSQIEADLSKDLKVLLRAARDRNVIKLPREQMVASCRKLLLLQLIRTPYAKKIGVRGFVDDDEPDRELLEQVSGAGFDVDSTEVREAYDRVRADALQERRSRMWSMSLLRFVHSPAEVLPDVVRATLNKGVLIAEAERGSAFVLGDRGAMSTAGKGEDLYHANSEIFFPLSPDIALSLAGKRDRIEPVSLGKASVRAINRSTVEHNDVVVSHSDALLKSLANPR